MDMYTSRKTFKLDLYKIVRVLNIYVQYATFGT